MSDPMFDRYKPWADDVVDEEDENGPKVETDSTFTDTKIGKGCTAERFPYPTYNRITHRADAQIQSILDNGIAMGADGIDAEILEGRMSSACATSHGLSAANRYNIGSSTTRFSRIWPTRINGVAKCLAIDCKALTDSTNSSLVYVIDRDAGTVVTHDVSAGFDPASSWHLKGICADGTYCYVAAIPSGVTLDNTRYYVQAFDLATWNVRVGWPTYGVNAAGNGGFAYPCDLIIANGTYLAIGDAYYSMPDLYLINRATGVVASSGHGDRDTTGYLEGLCSNGTYLFFSVSGHLCSASIANLSVGCGGTNWPYTTSGAISRIACRGDLVAVCHGGTSAIVEVARVQNAKYATITLANNTPYAHGVAFDDTSLWIRATRLVGSTRRQEMVQCALQGLIPENSTVAATLSLPTGAYNSRIFDTDLVHPTAPDGMDLRWDGRDLWIPGEATATATEFNPYLFRYPHTRNNRGILY